MAESKAYYEKVEITMQINEEIITRKTKLMAKAWALQNKLNGVYDNTKDQLIDMIELGKLAQESLTVWSVQEQINAVRSTIKRDNQQ